jgi:DNA polymerase elongation subunit (family B)
MSYIDAIVERDKNIILVSERDQKGQRILVQHPTKYVVYWPSERGKFTSIHGTKLDRYQTTKLKEFQKEISLLPKEGLHESDINPIFRCLYDNYKDAPAPELHVGFFDIEVDFDPLRGYSSVDDAFAPITAISLYLNWLGRNFTLVIKPKGMSTAAAEAITAEFEDTMLCRDEKELLDVFLKLIEDCDVLTGWNSESFDIPYIHNRIVQIMDKNETRRLCLWNKLPKKREYESYGRQQITYDLVGRVHLDYLQLYRKHTYHEMHSYRLDFVGEYEVNEKKVPYEGTLDQLYNNDFRKFIEYSRQDVMLLVKIDAKLKFIDLANNLAHTNCVLFQTTMGAVALIDQAIVNAAHDQDLIVPNRKRETAEERDIRHEEEADLGGSVVGAYVADPKPGMHDWIGGVDINSLYPSAIRALNMSPETIVGHIRPEMTDKLIMKRVKEERRSFADAWNNMFGTLEYTAVMEQQLIPITVDFEDGSEVTVTAQEVYDLVFKSGKKLMISANGTIFSYEKPGVIPGVLARWYAERKELQAEYRKYAKLGDDESDPDKKSEYKKLAVFYDQRQLIKKILLNSLYGAVGNPGSRWFDPRVAQSTTLSGRCVVRHMQGKINEIITGEYDYVGASIIYGDSVTGDTVIRTDSGEMTIAQLFDECIEHAKTSDGKEYGLWSQSKVIGFNAYEMEPILRNIETVMRHKTKKKLYRITTETGKSVTVTEDHSLMIDRDGFLLEVKPTEISETDLIITLKI